MFLKPSSSNESSVFSLNGTQAADWDYFNWCMDFPIGLVIWLAISVICFLLGFPASLWVLHELLQRQRLISDIFMLSLAVIDLIFTAQLPFSISNFMLWHIKEMEIPFDFIYSLSLIGRPLFMACICWDCYVAVVHPIVYKTSKKFIVVKKAIAITIGFITVVAGLLLSNMSWLIMTSFTAITLILSLPVITYCDISILRVLRKSHPTGKSSIHPQKQQALYTITNSLFMTFVIYLPPGIIFTFGKLMPFSEEELFCCLDFFAFGFIMLGSVIMPVLYLVNAGKLDTFRNWWNINHVVDNGGIFSIGTV